ncbi:hypothetical protein [Haladaptatus sp. W1]|uniref:hypothetical protein n=1 Tax=Haladaptatus sp. W1 TaxID=1897478 RepID=UPI0020C801D4|nr:hypothetical protein [Haladaptatus sp. W1]
MAMEGGENDVVEVDAAPSRLHIGSSLPTNNRAVLTFYLLGIVRWSLVATFAVV